jgi:phosphatidate phosphatase APP1
MPELYGSLASSLSNPQFVYISGSPYQLYPYLNSFISSSFPEEAQGPIFLKNLTLTSIDSIEGFIGGGEATLDYKLDQIERVQAMYPKKKFLVVGDSTEKDPEIYAEA